MLLFNSVHVTPARCAGTVLATVCCATPLLGVVLGALGFAAWLAKADYVLIPTLLICLGLLGIGLYRRPRWEHARSRCEGEALEPGRNGDTPEEFAAYIQSEITKWAKVVNAAGIKPEQK